MDRRMKSLSSRDNGEMTIFNWLALETSTDVLSLAVARGCQTWLHTGEGGAKASNDGLPVLLELMNQAQLNWTDVTAIVFGRGPGAFTGLRTACSMAQGLALGADRRVLPIDTLLAVAEEARHAHPDAPGRVLAVLDARMQQVYAAAYEHGPNGWQCVQEPALHSPGELCWPDHWAQEEFAAAGNAWESYADQWPSALTPLRWKVLPTATALLRLAPQAWRDGKAVPPELALPLYVRDKVAQTTDERARQQAVSSRSA